MPLYHTISSLSGTKRSVEAKQVPWNDEPDTDEVQHNPNEKQQYTVH